MKSVCLKKWQIILYETVKSKFYKGCLILQSVFSQFFISCKYSSLRLRWCENIVVTYNKNIATTNMYTIICYVINYGSFVRLIIHRLKAFIKKNWTCIYSTQRYVLLHVTGIQWMKTSDTTWLIDVQLLAVPINSVQLSFYSFRKVLVTEIKPSHRLHLQ